MRDGPEQALAVQALHLDADGVAELHELGAGLAIQNGFDGALLRDAAVAFGPFTLAVVLNAFVAPVPLPTMEPARTLRVLQMCAISCPK